MPLTREQRTADAAFLVAQAGVTRHDEPGPGSASASLVSLAYGLIDLEQVSLPTSGSELAPCERIHDRLPAHRRTETVALALARQREALVRRKCG